MAQIFNSMSSFYGTLQDSGTFACNVQLQLVGQIVFRYGHPTEISQRPCNTDSPFKDFDYVGGDNDCCNFQGLSNCPTGQNTVCLNAYGCSGDSYRTAPGCYQWGGESSSWECSPGDSCYKKKTSIQQAGGSCSPISTSASVIDESAMLGDFTEWVNDNRLALETTFGGAVDNAMLFSGKDFRGSTIGLAGINAMCSSTRSGSVIQATSLSHIHIAATAAHEMGHNFGMQHDGSGVTGFLMAPSVGGVPATAFSSASKQYINTFMTSAYDSNSRCLENNPGARTWDVARCGDGVVDDSEDCDPGIGVSDSCCNSATCQFQGGCACSAADPCCTSAGQFEAAGTTCRAAASSECDVAEACSGSSSSCSTDYFTVAGTACGSGGEDKCYRGSCVAKDDDCTFPLQRCEGAVFGTACKGIYCSATGSGTCSGSSSRSASDGVPCGAGRQCYTDAGAGDTAEAACILSSALRVFNWELSAPRLMHCCTSFKQMSFLM